MPGEESLDQLVNDYMSEVSEEGDESVGQPQQIDLKAERDAANIGKGRLASETRKNVSVDKLVNDIKSAPRENVNKKIEQLMSKFEQLETRNKLLETQLQNVGQSVTKANDRDILSDIAKMEDEVFQSEMVSNELVQDLFDKGTRQKVREHYNNAVVQEGRYFKPAESLAILAFPKVLAELVKYREKQAMHQEFIGGMDTGSSKDYGDVSFVKTDRDRRRLAEEVVRGMF